MRTRFMHIADVHLGYAQYGSSNRYNDFYHSFAKAIDTALKEEVDFVIIAGDLFHQRILSPQTLLQAAHELERLNRATIRVVGVMGNHERPHYTHRVSWLDFLAGRGLMILLRPHYVENGEADKDLVFAPYQNMEGGYVDLGAVRVYGIGYAGASMSRLIPDAVLTLGRMHEAGRPAFTILVTHAGLEGIIPNFAADLTREQIAMLRPHVDYLALGHIHKPHQEEGWVFNPGSLEPNSTTEVDYRGGALLIDLDTDRDPVIQTESRQFSDRPFVRLYFSVSEYESPEALYAGIEAHLAEQNQSYDRRPVVQYVLEGLLHFDRQSLEMYRVETMIQQSFNPITTRIQNSIAPAEYEVTAGSGQISRAELESGVLSDLIARDARYRGHAGQWANTMREMKRMALERNSPDTIVEHLRAESNRIIELEPAHADNES